METQTIYLAVLATVITAAFYLYIGSEDSRRLRSAGDYFLYMRQLKPGQVFGTFYASGMSLATVFIAFLQLAPYLGTKLIWSVIFYCMGHVVLYLIAPQILRFAGKGITLHGFLKERYQSPSLRYVASVATTVGFLGVFATELLVGSHVFSALFNSQSGYWLALTAVATVVLAYSILGGFKSVVRTDKYQSVGIIFVAGLLVAVGLTIGAENDAPLIPTDLTESWMLPAVMMLNFFLINVAFPLVDMSAWQRVVASESEEVAKSGLTRAIIMFAITWSAILFAGLSLTEYSQQDETGGLVTALITFGSSSYLLAILSAIGFAALIAAMVSTADTFLIAAGQTVAMDVRDKEFFEKPEHTDTDNKDESKRLFMPEEDARVVNRTRVAMVVLSVLGLAFCIFLKVIGFKVAELVFAVYGSALSLVPAVFLGLFSKTNDWLRKISNSAIVSVVSGVVLGWVYGILAVISPEEGTFWYLLAHSLDWVLGSPSAYNAPTVSFGIAVLVISAGALLALGGKKSG